MKYEYGAYRHDEGTVELTSVTKQKNYSPRGRPASIRITHSCQGELLATPGATPQAMQDELRSKIQELETAYSRDGSDAGLLHNDLARSQHYLVSADSLSGTRIIAPPSFPKGAGAEYASFRSFAFAIFADFISPDLDPLFDWQESLSFQGTGGPRYVVTELDSGRPDVQQVSRFTAQTIVQSGTATGLFSWPAPPPQIYGQGENFQGPSSSVVYQPAKKLGNSDWLFPISWNYVFKLSTPRTGRPGTK